MSEYQGQHEGEPADEHVEEPIVGDAPPKAHTLFSNAAYDRLKWVAQVLLPALALFYIALAPLWGLPKQEEVAGTIVAVDLLLGTLLGLSTRQYQNSDAAYDGHMFVGPGETPNSKTVGLQVTTPPQDLSGKSSVRFKIHEQ